MKKNTSMIVLFYMMVYLVWGSTYLTMKMTVETMHPLAMVGLRWTMGGLLFLIYCYWKDSGLKVTARELLSSLIMGVLLILVPNILVGTAVQHMNSYLVSIVLVMIPVGTAVFDRILLGKRIHPVVLAGMLIGITGIALLLYDGRSIQQSFTKEVVMLISAVLAISFGTTIGHKVSAGRNVILHTGLQMFTSGLIALVATAVLRPQYLVHAVDASARSILALTYLITIGSLTFGAYTYLIKYEPAVRVTSYSLVNPVIAVILGIVIAHEAPARYMAVGLPIVLVGIALMLHGEQLMVYAKAKAADLPLFGQS